MNIFQEMKERVTARQVAEKYGLKVRQNGMACCPFHNDKHPSMKIDRNYYCFACGAKGDAVNYVAILFGLSQFEAAKKINEDFSLEIPIGQPEEKRKQISGFKKKEKVQTKSIRRKKIERNFNRKESKQYLLMVIIILKKRKKASNIQQKIQRSELFFRKWEQNANLTGNIKIDLMYHQN